MEIQYRFFDFNSDSDINQWIDLYRICFHDNVSRDFLFWVHKDNPFLKNYVHSICIAETGGRLIGAVSIIPTQFLVVEKNKTHIINVGKICKAMVHPNFQNRGIFSQLMKTVHQAAIHNGYDLLLTLSNNPYSFQGFIRKDWTFVMDLQWKVLYISSPLSGKNKPDSFSAIVKKYSAAPLFALYNGLIPHRRHTYQVLVDDARNSFDAIDKIRNSDSGVSGIFGIRTPEFLGWRFSYEHAEFKCLTLQDQNQPLAYIVFEIPKHGNNALILDIYCHKNDKDIALVLLSEAVKYLKDHNIRSLWASIPERDWIFSEIFSIRHGFLNHSAEKGAISKPRLLVYPVGNRKLLSEVPEKNQWNIQASDTCLFWG